jgi:hypothetical protein
MEPTKTKRTFCLNKPDVFFFRFWGIPFKGIFSVDSNKKISGLVRRARELLCFDAALSPLLIKWSAAAERRTDGDDSLSFIGGRYERALFSQIKIITTTVSKQPQSSDTRSKNALFLRLEIETEREWGTAACAFVCVRICGPIIAGASPLAVRESQRDTHTHTKSECKYRFSTGGKQCGRTTQQQQQQRHSHTLLSFAPICSRALEEKRKIAFVSSSSRESNSGPRHQSKRQSLRFAKAISAAPYHGKPAHSCKMRNALAFLSPCFHFSLSWISFVCSQETPRSRCQIVVREFAFCRVEMPLFLGASSYLCN